MMAHMQNIISQWLVSLKHYILMCLFLSSPERLPYNPYCTALTIFAYFLTGLTLVDEQHGYGVICAQITLELGMLSLIAYCGLRWKKSLPRFPQTFSALTGVNLIITIVTIPIYRTIIDNESSIESLLIFVFRLIQFWNLAVLSLIFKRSMEISTRVSAMITFNYFVVYLFLVFWFPW